MPICFRLLIQLTRRAASRAAWTAGKSRAISTAMIEITTNNSIRVNARRVRMDWTPDDGRSVRKTT
jgi:hypothetical protein